MMWGKTASFAILSNGAARYLFIYTRCGGHDSVAAASVRGEHRQSYKHRLFHMAVRGDCTAEH